MRRFATMFAMIALVALLALGLGLYFELHMGGGLRPDDGTTVLTLPENEPQNAKEWALMEAKTCAELGYNGYINAGGHPNGACPFGDFTGTGYSTNRNNIPTCKPRWWERMTLVGDEEAEGDDGWYRCRVWKRNRSMGWSETLFGRRSGVFWQTFWKRILRIP